MCKGGLLYQNLPLQTFLLESPYFVKMVSACHVIVLLLCECNLMFSCHILSVDTKDCFKNAFKILLVSADDWKFVTMVLIAILLKISFFVNKSDNLLILIQQLSFYIWPHPKKISIRVHGVFQKCLNLGGYILAHYIYMLIRHSVWFQRAWICWLNTFCGQPT